MSLWMQAVKKNDRKGCSNVCVGTEYQVSQNKVSQNNPSVARPRTDCFEGCTQDGNYVCATCSKTQPQKLQLENIVSNKILLGVGYS